MRVLDTTIQNDTCLGRCGQCVCVYALPPAPEPWPGPFSFPLRIPTPCTKRSMDEEQTLGGSSRGRVPRLCLRLHKRLRIGSPCRRNGYAQANSFLQQLHSEQMQRRQHARQPCDANMHSQAHELRMSSRNPRFGPGVYCKRRCHSCGLRGHAPWQAEPVKWISGPALCWEMLYSAPMVGRVGACSARGAWCKTLRPQGKEEMKVASAGSTANLQRVVRSFQEWTSLKESKRSSFNTFAIS